MTIYNERSSWLCGAKSDLIIFGIWHHIRLTVHPSGSCVSSSRNAEGDGSADLGWSFWRVQEEKNNAEIWCYEIEILTERQIWKVARVFLVVPPAIIVSFAIANYKSSYVIRCRSVKVLIIFLSRKISYSFQRLFTWNSFSDLKLTFQPV